MWVSFGRFDSATLLGDGESEMGMGATATVEQAVVKSSDRWDRIKANLAAKITPQAYQNWLLRTELESQDNESLRILVPDQVTKDFLEQEYGEEVRNSIRDLKLEVREIVYVVATERAAPGSFYKRAGAAVLRRPQDRNSRSGSRRPNLFRLSGICAGAADVPEFPECRAFLRPGAAAA